MSMERNIFENSTENQDLIVLPETKTISNTQGANKKKKKEDAVDKLQETIMKLGEIFPDAVKDGEVDFEKLKTVFDKKEEVLPVILQKKESINMPFKGDIEQKNLTQRERNAECRRRRREQREAQHRSYVERMEREAREAEEYARQEERKKIFAVVGAVIVTLVLIYFFGLLGPAVFGLLAGGFLSGGKIK